ncbi:PucR family transcriptional regulator, purine catabolism regulatory protein [Candidatus Hakubella thermalkaliphila]|uniref:PucR family transcriptional regulator, purine catabolism regulatory protein n=1 Tax=Candidatus Hakubella thermalkaliphila TaxID=2754717 RepID=A0A6V8P7X5_9ACTN|nr:PucR family transcriptional regulator ligand-binding domain-containing protein [Candidatus Hakubella thermalkaliphila]GFP21005.1 PucR family transcriptional regulator, purine catabolism regulatory protein [Candidatus Hakubella thermalkaliphila]GFP26876.1 PucR family transcriptional regulator, purine catabolism regulatory protein [Candidatus Hakubella thermalkaliphila]
MVCTVGYLYQKGVLQPAELVAGSSGLDNLVSWLHVVEIFDDLSLFHGQEIVFTTAFDVRDDPWQQAELVRELAGRGVSALIVKKGYYLYTISPQMKEAADRHSLPLFSVSVDTDLMALTRSVSRCLLEQQLQRDMASNFLSQLLEGDLAEPVNVAQRVRSLGIPTGIFYFILQVDLGNVKAFLQSSPHSEEIEMARLQSRIAELVQTVFPEHRYPVPLWYRGDNFVLLVPCTDENEETPLTLAEALRQKMEASLVPITATVGMSSCFKNLLKAPRYLKEASLAIEIIRRIKEGDQVTPLSQLQPYSILLSIADGEEARNYVVSLLGPLEAADKQRRGDLLSTLQLFLESDGNVKLTAQKLFVHRNTLRYRLHQIEKLLGHTLDSSAYRFSLQLALYLRNLQSR